ncbi:mCG49636, isoform CRA_b [Mus musculus]|nr:mCG49636, isoform CRA_b [Mus musculus]
MLMDRALGRPGCSGQETLIGEEQLTSCLQSCLGSCELPVK